MAYTSVSITGYNANPPEDDGTVASSNEIAWDKHKTKLGDPLKTAIESINTNVGTAITAAEARVPVGAIMPYAGATAPSGWLLCDATPANRTTYSDLFTEIGTTYGVGDGSTTFGLPDLTGRVIAGKEASETRLTTAVSGIDGGTLGAAGAAEDKEIAKANIPNYSLSSASLTGSTTDNLPAATMTSTSIVSADDSGGSNAAAGASGATAATTAAYTTTIGGTVPSGGSGTPLPVVQPTMVLNYIIKF